MLPFFLWVLSRDERICFFENGHKTGKKKFFFFFFLLECRRCHWLFFFLLRYIISFLVLQSRGQAQPTSSCGATDSMCVSRSRSKKNTCLRILDRLSPSFLLLPLLDGGSITDLCTRLLLAKSCSFATPTFPHEKIGCACGALFAAARYRFLATFMAGARLGMLETPFSIVAARTSRSSSRARALLSCCFFVLRCTDRLSLYFMIFFRHHASTAQQTFGDADAAAARAAFFVLHNGTVAGIASHGALAGRFPNQFGLEARSRNRPNGRNRNRNQPRRHGYSIDFLPGGYTLAPLLFVLGGSSESVRFNTSMMTNFCDL